MYLLWKIAAAGFAMDQITKAIAAVLVEGHEPRRPLGGAVTFTAFRNSGAAGSFAPRATLVFTLLAIVVLILIARVGYMSAQLTTPDRPLFEEERQEYGSPEELAEAARHYLAYADSFRVPDGDTVVHEVALCLYPNWMGNGQTRVARLDGRTLQLAPPAPLSVGGRQRTGILTWERAEPH
ncbi:lipocalin-like domain-containing protein [Streptomyces sp. NBC_00316]|uniref:lipocalin-like domain-containing protein n=1 Tax=Streptomyces sp. NBC_00316 TaxID=2975710 RepID=UPI002E2ADE3E|nr:lipocalin-like domain-containing protein [Streptomyces sp. NBC_00316]